MIAVFYLEINLSFFAASSDDNIYHKDFLVVS